MSTLGRTYGCRPDPAPKPRDADAYFEPTTAPGLERAALPRAFDLRPQFWRLKIDVWDQGSEGSCTAHAWAGLVAYLRGVAKRPNLFTPSRQFIYWCERQFEGTADRDAGAWVSSGARVLANFGACPEPAWPYTAANLTTTPSADAFAAAKHHRITKQAFVNNADLRAMKRCLVARYPFVIGFYVFQSFESAEVAKTGVVPMPTPDDGDQLLGGHAACVVGYDDISRRFIVRNSWGASWGQAGYCTMPYAYFTQGTTAFDAHMAHGAT